MAIFNPITSREHQIVRSLGNTDWDIIEQRDRVVCMDGPGILIGKNGHKRWVKPIQINA